MRTSSGVSVVIPARNEEETVSAVVRGVMALGRTVVDEVVVVDDSSSDATAAAAAAAGARVVSAAQVLPAHGTGPGKGEAMWKGLAATTGDIVVFLDADLDPFEPGWVEALMRPLLQHPEVALVKGTYDREGEGGRVTELTARPALSLLFPEVAAVLRQPLGGEYAGRRSALEQVSFVRGYGVDLALVLDVVERWGLAGLAQVELGSRSHRSRPLAELAPMAEAVLHVALHRGAGHAEAPASCPPLTGIRPVPSRRTA